jgi:hypothetical protein
MPGVNLVVGDWRYDSHCASITRSMTCQERICIRLSLWSKPGMDLMDSPK